MKRLLCVLFLTFTFFNLFSTDFSSFFNDKISDSEKEMIYSGKVYFKSVGKLKKAGMVRNQYTAQAIDTIKELNPNHLSEIIQIRPYEGNENLISQLAFILGNVENYVGIPYFSERNQKWYDLYSEAEILSDKTENGIQTIDARFYMEPFGYYTSRTRIENKGDYYFFTMRNTEKLRYYDKFDAVKKGNMMAAISVFRYEDYWILYGLGGADIIKLPFIEKRAETSFTNRIKAFCTAIFDKLQLLQLQDS